MGWGNSKVGETPQGKGPDQGPLSPWPTAILQRPPWQTSYKGCAKSSQCESGFFGFTMNPENYMGSKRHCCQKDGCNQDPLPGKPQLSPTAGVPPCPPLPRQSQL